MYPLNIKEQEELDKFLEKHLKSGWIWSSKSLCTAFFFFMKKKDESLWLVQDYRWLKYLLPLIQELINKVQGVKYFTKLNIQ